MPSVGFVTQHSVMTLPLEADSHRLWIITQQFTTTTSIHKLKRHLSCKSVTHTPPLQFVVTECSSVCVERAMTQVSLISVFIPLLPTVIRCPSCLPVSPASISFILPHLFYLPPVILLIHPALPNSLQSVLLPLSFMTCEVP